jgi:DNA-binding response OmpR family regulator
VSRILVIEDNVDLAFGLQRTLEFEGHQVEVCGDGEQGIANATEREPDLILLDVMLPGADGFAVLRRMRQGGLGMPVLMLTARGEESDVVLGFDSGADDYVTKPFSTAELLARVRALLRRAATTLGNGAAIERFGDVEVNVAARTVRRAGEPVSLTPRELDLLIALLRRNGTVAARSDLLREVWQWENTDITTRTVDIHVAELRRKLEDDPSNPRHILTARKAGYRIRQSGT